MGEKWVVCPTCNGDGWGSDNGLCWGCGGAGEVEDWRAPETFEERADRLLDEYKDGQCDGSRT